MSARWRVLGARGSLRRRLLLNTLVALALCLALATAVLFLEFFEHLEEKLDENLTAEATEIIGHLDPARPHLGLDPDALRIRGAQGRYRYTIYDGSGRVLVGGERSPHIARQIATVQLGQPRRIDLPGDRIGLAMRARLDDTDFVTLVSTRPAGADLTLWQKVLDEVSEGIWWVVLIVLVVLTAAALTARRVLRPVEALSAEARKIGPEATDHRLSRQNVPTEAQPLIDAVNGAFDRLEQGYLAQRDFSSNVAHEIRTPLAVLRSSIDRIADPELRRSLAEDVQRLDRMFEQIVDLARADATGATRFEPVDLHRIAVEVASELAGEAVRSGHDLTVTEAETVWVSGNANLLAIALRNLVRNAILYSPAGTEIEIELVRSPPGWKVHDRGPGVPDHLKQDLFERFRRGDEWQAARNGSGIGLAIVRSVARAHGATTRIIDRERGGSTFTFLFADLPGKT